MSTAEHQPDDAMLPALQGPHPHSHVGLSGKEAEALAVRAALEAAGVQVADPAYVAHAAFPDDEGAEVAAHRAFEAVLRQCACPESAVLVLRRPSGRVEALEHHHTDPTCPVVLAAGHPELETTP